MLPFLSPILHWVQPGLKVSGSSSKELSTEVAHIVDFIPPGPPPPSGPHRYLFMLYEQPPGFDGKALGQTLGKPASAEEGAPFGLWNRVRFDYDGLVKKAGLGEIVAVNFFTSN